MSNQPPQSPTQFKPKVAASTANPAQTPTRPVPQTAEAIERARHDKTQRALADSQEQATKHATDAAFKAGQLDQKGKGRIQHYLEAYAQVFICMLLIAVSMVIVRQGDSWVGWLAVKNHEQARIDSDLDATFNAPVVAPNNK